MRQLPLFALPAGGAAVVEGHRARLAACLNAGLIDRAGLTSLTARAFAMLGMPRPWASAPAKATRGGQATSERVLAQARDRYTRALHRAAECGVTGAAVRQAEAFALRARRAALNPATRPAALRFLEIAIAALGEPARPPKAAPASRKPRPYNPAAAALRRREVARLRRP